MKKVDIRVNKSYLQMLINALDSLKQTSKFSEKDARTFDNLEQILEETLYELEEDDLYVEDANGFRKPKKEMFDA